MGKGFALSVQSGTSTLPDVLVVTDKPTTLKKFDMIPQIFGGFSVGNPHIKFAESLDKAIQARKKAEAHKLAVAKKKAAEKARIKAEKQRAAVIAAQIAANHSYHEVTPVYQSSCSDPKSCIYQKESGNNPSATNPSGCYGLGQDCNGIVLGKCGTNYTCQDAYFTSYAISRYGSWAAAWAFWQANGWW